MPGDLPSYGILVGDLAFLVGDFGYLKDFFLFPGEVGELPI
jgi:hypothetical protein